MADVLTTRELNRAYLARQMLLERQAAPVPEVVERLVGLQAQDPVHPYYALWSRISDFDPEELSSLISERQAVRVAVMRTTLHLVTARDALTLAPLMAPVLSRTLRSTSFGKGTVGLDLGKVVTQGQRLVEEKPLTLSQMGKGLQELWPEREATDLARTVHYLTPLVQIPPRGLWKKTMQATWTTLRSWVGQDVDPEPSIDAVVLRYLAAFGPASTADARTWCGLPGLRDVFERLRPQLRTFRDEKGRELFDLPDAPRPPADTPAPVRFLPEYDNLFLSHADRSRIYSEEVARRFTSVNGVGPNVLSVDGFIAGRWKLSREKRAVRLLIEAFEPPSKAVRTALETEGEALLAFAADDAEERSVEFVSNLT